MVMDNTYCNPKAIFSEFAQISFCFFLVRNLGKVTRIERFWVVLGRVWAFFAGSRVGEKLSFSLY